MNGLFAMYLQNGICMSVVALALKMLSPLLERRYSAKCRYSLWILLFMAMLLPMRPTVNIKSPVFLQPVLDSSAEPIAAYGISPAAFAAGPFGLMPILAYIWPIGMLLCLGLQIYRHRRFVSAIRRWRSRIENKKIIDTFSHIKSEMGISRDISLWVCPCVKTPMMIGILYPAVVLPSTDAPLDELRPILKHELVHYKRCDLIIKYLFFVATLIHWFNPALFLMAKEAGNLCEISCDDEVLKDADMKTRAEYGEAIVSVIRNGKALQTAFSTNFYSNSNAIKSRVHALMDTKRKRFSLFPLMFFFALSLCAITAFSLAPAAPANAAEKTAMQDNNASESAFGYNFEESSAPSGTSATPTADNDDDLQSYPKKDGYYFTIEQSSQSESATQNGAYVTDNPTIVFTLDE